MDERSSIFEVWREALDVVRQYPWLTLAPAVPLAAGTEIPTYVIENRLVLEQLLSYLASTVAYYVFLVYVEGLVDDHVNGREDIASRSVLEELRGAAPFTPRVLGAALVASLLASVSLVLLVIPGVWLFTRWSLSTPVICRENLGVFASLKRSNGLVRGRFWFVLGTATLAFALEQVVTHAGALVAGSITGSETWGEWAGGSVVATVAIPLAALATSLAYSKISPPAKLTVSP